jgi:hypothetical protein
MVKTFAVRIISPVLVLTALAFGCVNQAEIALARTSVYDTDFANVFDAVSKAARANYPNLDENAGNGTIKTAWHQVKFNTSNEDPRSAQLSSSAQGFAGGQQAGAGTPVRGVYKRYFVRFDLAVVGGRPWRVRVIGRASEWEPGMAVPNELSGAAVPGWLPGRVDAMTVAIYKRLKSVAIVQAAPEVKVVEDDRTNPNVFSNVPADAAKVLAAISDALKVRDVSALRPYLDRDVVWSKGAAPGAETAVVMWQADPVFLDEMQAAIAACSAGQSQEVLCSPAATTPGAPRTVLTLSARTGQWKITQFLTARAQ